MNIYTIGYTKKSAQVFFNILKNKGIDVVVDIRLNNKSQLSGYTKKNDFAFFLNEICNIKYIHSVELAPTKELLDGYKKGTIPWDEYIVIYNNMLDSKDLTDLLGMNDNQRVCFLCSEVEPQQCHRSLLSNHLVNNYNHTFEEHL